jgi:hypothetical protein
MLGMSLLFVCAEAAPKAETKRREAMIRLRMSVNLLENFFRVNSFKFGFQSAGPRDL